MQDTGNDLAAISQKRDAEIAAAKKTADLKAQINKENRAKQIQDLRDTEAENIRIIQNSGQTQKQIDDAVFAEKIRSLREISQAIKNQLTAEQIDMRAHAAAKRQYTQDEVIAKKSSLKEIQDAYKTQITALNALEQEHRDKAIALEKEIRDFKKSAQDGLREIQRAGMSEAELSADKQLEIEQKTAQLKELLRNEEYAKAAELGKELTNLSKQQAIDAKGGDYRDKIIAEGEYKGVVDLTTTALEKQKTLENEKADKAKFDAEMQRQASENLTTQIGALNDTLTKGGELKVIVDATQVTALHAEIDKIPKDIVINVTYNKQGEPSFTQARNQGGFIHAIKQFAFGGHVSGTGNSDTVPAMLTPGEFVLRKSAVQRLNPQFLHALNAGKINTTNAAQSLGAYDLNLSMGDINVPANVSAQNQDVLKTLIKQLEQQKRVQR